MAARQPTIVATSIGFQLEGPDPTNLRPGPSYRMAADLARAGDHPKVVHPRHRARATTCPGWPPTHNAFAKIGFISSHLTLFPMPNYPDVRAHLLAQDVIWVGGGSTANLLALWRLHGLDVILRECWEAGVVLKGVSAGSHLLARGRDDRLVRADAPAHHQRARRSCPTPTARTTTSRSSVAR